MSGYKELNIKMKVDTYNDLRNYLHNELKITKKDIEEMVSKLIGAVIEKQIVDGRLAHVMDGKINKAVTDAISRLSNSPSWGLSDRIEKVVDDAIGRKIKEEVFKRLGNYKLS